MIDTYRSYPFWKTTPADVDDAIAHASHAEHSVLAKTPGGHSVHLLAYGAKPDYCRRANYSSACGAKDPRFYADREGKPATILLIGATHGQETEGVAALLNLISLIETGRDLRGEEVPSLMEAYRASGCRLLIIPVYNADGRARCIYDSMIGEPQEILRYYGTGTWKDGSLCGWPECKATHPILEAAGFLGAYYNDDGVNLMHDNFFAPMAEETRALLAMCDREAPECVIGLHGGSNSTNELLQPAYASLSCREGVHRLAEAGAALAQSRGLRSHVRPVGGIEKDPPASFNLTSAIHHVCGAVSATYESNEGLLAPNAFTAEEILLEHYCLFESLFTLSWRA